MEGKEEWVDGKDGWIERGLMGSKEWMGRQGE